MTVLELMSGILRAVRLALGGRGPAASHRIAGAPPVAAAAPVSAVPAVAAPAVAGFALRIEDVIPAEAPALPVDSEQGAALATHDPDAGRPALPPALGDARRFMLPARLRSVGKLNGPASRTPSAKVTAPGGPCVPLARIGARKQRAGAGLGTRVLRPAAARPSAQIIPFPSGRVGAGRKAA